MTTVSVSPTGPYGVKIEADKFGHGAVISSWVRLPNGKFGQIQKHGGIKLGDVMVAINDINITTTPHGDIKAMLGKSMPTKVLKFVSSTKYYQEKKLATAGRNDTGGKDAGNKTPHFMSIIKRARVNNFASSKFGEYEIMCQLRMASLSVGKEKTFKWSVWKRFSDFEQLHTQLSKTLGWHMDDISYPSSHTFVMSKLTPDFLEQRREELNEYWTKVIAIDKVTEFNKHHCSAALKAFIDVDGALLGDKATPSAGSTEEGGEKQTKGEKEKEEGGGGGGDSEECEDDSGGGGGGGGDAKKSADNSGSGAAARRGSSRRLSSRSGSTKSVMKRGSSSTAVSSSSSSSSKPPPPPAASSSSSSTPTPTPTPTPAATSSSSSSSSSAKKVASVSGAPPSTPARANLLGSIAALRKD